LHQTRKKSFYKDCLNCIAENEDNVWRNVHAIKDQIDIDIDISNLETLFSKKEEHTIKVSGNVKVNIG
jgi:hypothetical protein